MSRKKKKKEKVTQYTHEYSLRPNNPPVGLVTADTDRLNGKQRYEYDPHLDPQLQWAGKAEHTTFEVDTVSLHVHERIDPLTIIEKVRKKEEEPRQKSLFHYFEAAEQNPPLHEAIEFYKHAHGWSNRLVAGDSLLVMNSLVHKEGMAGKVQMIYIDPPYGIKYGSNFQPFVNKRDVKDGKDEDLSAEPEQIRAFRDTWELGIHSYLTYLRDRLLLARELLTESGSVFVQISDENLHHVRELMDEVFGTKNFIGIINFQKTGGLIAHQLIRTVDYLVWYARDANRMKWYRLYAQRRSGDTSLDRYDMVEEDDGKIRRIKKEEASSGVFPTGARRLQLTSLESVNPYTDFVYQGRTYSQRWKTSPQGLSRLAAANRLYVAGTKLRYRRYVDDFPVVPITDRWDSVQIGTGLTYVVQTSPLVIERCLLMTTDPGDLVFDPTCGSGTTAYVAEQWGRRWVTCDTSRVALTLSKQRLMTAVFDFYELAHPEEGVRSGFQYRTVPHVTLKSIANNPDLKEGMSREEIEAAIARQAPQETLYDQPLVDRKKRRVTGPFTVEAVPSERVRSLAELEEVDLPAVAEVAIAREGESSRQHLYLDELRSAGIRAKGGKVLRFARVETLPATRWLHAEGETAGEEPQRVVVSFGPDYAPLEQRQVELAIEEAHSLVPRPRMVVFAAFQFDPEAAKDIDEIQWPGVTVLKVQMNTDLLTEDLKKKRASNESFWLVGQPDVSLRREDGRFVVEVQGFDYYNPVTGDLESGGVSRIAMWLLDPDYDGRSLYPRQVFFPMADKAAGWGRVARQLKAQLDEELVEQYRGSVSLPFAPGKYGRAAVKIVDDRGIESMTIIELK